MRILSRHDWEADDCNLPTTTLPVTHAAHAFYLEIFRKLTATSQQLPEL